MTLQMRNEALENDEKGKQIFYNRQDAFELSDRVWTVCKNFLPKRCSHILFLNLINI